MKRKLVRMVTLEQFRDFIRNSHVTRRFAEAHNLVYFGSVGREDESRLVKGITISNTYRDSHYLVGTDFGRDMIFLQRSDTIRSANCKKKELYTWNILVLDLLPQASLPHMYIEGRNRHDSGYYETLAMKIREFAELPRGFFASYDPLFGTRFTVRMSAATSVQFPVLITPERAAILAHHFSSFDFEWHDDVLYVYFLSTRPSFAQLEHMLKAGVWLAGELDMSKQPTADSL